MSKRISGKKIAEKIKEQLKNEVLLIGKEIKFSIIYVGQDSVIDNFIKYKKKFGKDIGVSVRVYHFNKDIEQSTLISEIKRISNESSAVIIQLPLSDKFNTQEVLNVIPVEKDIDVLSEDAKKLFSLGENSMIPPVTGSIIEVFKEVNFPLVEKKIVIVGYGNLVGKPFSSWLLRNKIHFEIIDQKTDKEKKTLLLKDADVIISGVGSPNLIKKAMIKEGVVLIDGGTSETGKKVIGDIDKSCYEKALFYTPVPGGIGPITIAILYRNLFVKKKVRSL